MTRITVECSWITGSRDLDPFSNGSGGLRTNRASEEATGRIKIETAVEGFRARVHPSTAAVGIGFRRYQVRSVRGIERFKSRK